jgi:hypothetical protein
LIFAEGDVMNKVALNLDFKAIPRFRGTDLTCLIIPAVLR